MEFSLIFLSDFFIEASRPISLSEKSDSLVWDQFNSGKVMSSRGVDWIFCSMFFFCFLFFLDLLAYKRTITLISVQAILESMYTHRTTY